MFKHLFCAVLFTFAAAAAHANVIEGFDNVANLKGKGFILRNASTPVGANSFFQGNTLVFGAQTGPGDSYLGANYDSAAAGGTIDDWLISPQFSTSSSGTISFYVRAAGDSGFTDTFQYGMSSGGTGAADFSLNSLMTVPGSDWTEFRLNFAGTMVADSIGRFAIRYTGSGDSSNYVGIDSLSLPLPEPGSFLLAGLGLAGVIVLRRSKVAQSEQPISRLFS